MRYGFVDERAMIKTTLMSSCHWKPLYCFACNINSELLQNHTEKEIMPFKTTVNWLFNDM